jgi:hypothetical protein
MITTKRIYSIDRLDNITKSFRKDKKFSYLFLHLFKLRNANKHRVRLCPLLIKLNELNDDNN